MVTREAFVAEARKWIDVPWLHQGRNRYGIDCIGLLIVTAKALGLTEYDAKGYGIAPDAEFLKAECDRLMARIPRSDVQPADVYLMRFTRHPQHIGIATDFGLLHAWAGAGRVTETSMPLSWRSRVVQAYRVPGVA